MVPSMVSHVFNHLDDNHAENRLTHMIDASMSLFESDAQRHAIKAEAPPQVSWPFGYTISGCFAYIISSNA